MRGEDKLLLMIGGLHIKMNFVNLIGYWLTGNSRITTQTQAEVTSGHADAILKCSHLTRAYYAHQVTAPSPGILKRTAYDTYMPTAILNLSLLKTGVTRKQRCIHSSNIGHWLLTWSCCYSHLFIHFEHEIFTWTFRVCKILCFWCFLQTTQTMLDGYLYTWETWFFSKPSIHHFTRNSYQKKL